MSLTLRAPPVVRITTPVAVADPARIAALLRSAARRASPDDFVALTSLALAVETCEPASPGAWQGCTVTLDPGEAEVDASDRAMGELARDVIARAREARGGGRAVELFLCAVVDREGSDA